MTWTWCNSPWFLSDNTMTVKVATCDEPGLRCVETLAVPHCLPPCQGIFSDVSPASLETPPDWEWTSLSSIMTQYETYKNNFTQQPTFPLNTVKGN